MHALLWFVPNDASISEGASELTSEPINDLLISPVSPGELVIKIGIVKYAFPEPFGSFMEDQLTVNDFQILPISSEHAAIVSCLPIHHHDPFDRSLLAQSLSGDIAIINADSLLDRHSGCRHW